MSLLKCGGQKAEPALSPLIPGKKTQMFKLHKEELSLIASFTVTTTWAGSQVSTLFFFFLIIFNEEAIQCRYPMVPHIECCKVRKCLLGYNK